MLAHYRFSISAIFLMCLFFCAPVKAQDMFVRPTNQAPHAVDLGIATKPAVQPHAPMATPSVAPPQQVAPIQAPVQQVRPIERPTPLPTPTPPPALFTKKGNVEIITVDEAPNVIPPGNGPNLLSIIMQPGAIGQMEVNDVYKALGLNVQEIAANCVYESMAILNTGSVASAIPMGQLTNAQQHFSGTLNGVDIIPTLACRRIRAPINGTIIQQGAYYKVGAANVSCPAPPHGGSVQLTFRFLGNGRGDCQYK